MILIDLLETLILNFEVWSETKTIRFIFKPSYEMYRIFSLRQKFSVKFKSGGRKERMSKSSLLMTGL